jgi:ABC-2 type transport system permease protein
MFTLSRLFSLQLSKMWNDPMIFMFIFIQPIIFSMLFGYLFKSFEGNEVSIVIFFGVAQMAMWQVLLYSGGVIVRHEFNIDKTIPYTLISSSNLLIIWIYRLVACVIFSTPATIMSLSVGSLLFGLKISLEVHLITICLILFLISLFSIGLPLILLLFLNPHGGKIIQTIAYPIFLLSGMIISIDMFPKPIYIVSLLFPVTWSTKFAQELLGKGDWNINFLCGSMIASILYLLFAVSIFRLIMTKVKEKGEMNL